MGHCVGPALSVREDEGGRRRWNTYSDIIELHGGGEIRALAITITAELTVGRLGGNLTGDCEGWSEG